MNESYIEVAVVVDEWLIQTGTSCLQYLAKVVNCKSAIDGLFTWLAAVSLGVHLNIIHATGIWTSQKLDITVLTDPTIVYVLRCFISAPAMHLQDPDKHESSDLDYVMPFKHPAEMENCYITIPQVLNKPVINVQDRLNETVLQRLSDTLPIQNLLADLLGCSRDEYRCMMVEWLSFTSLHVHMIEKWLAVRDLTLSEYLDHLC